MARVIVGCWQLAADHGGSWERERLLAELEALVDVGYTTFDCADIYTGVEGLLGELLRRIGPERAQVHTKYVPDRSELAALRPADVRRAIDRSLTRLGVERLDLVQLHWWDWSVPGWLEAAAQLDALRREGKVRCLGVTNFDVLHLRELLAAGLPVVSNQVQYSLVDRRPEHGMAALCLGHDVALLCYGSLAGGFLSDHWLGAAAPEGALENRSLAKYRLILDETGEWSRFQELLAEVSAVAKRHGVSVAATAVRWVLDRPGVAAAVVGAGMRSRLDEMAGIASLRCDPVDRARLEHALPVGTAGPAGDIYGLERVGDGRHAAVLRTELHGKETE